MLNLDIISFLRCCATPLRRRREVTELFHRSCVETLDNADDQLDGAIVILPVDDSVVRVRVACRHDKCNRRCSTIRLLDFCRIVTIAQPQIHLVAVPISPGGFAEPKQQTCDWEVD